MQLSKLLKKLNKKEQQYFKLKNELQQYVEQEYVKTLLSIIPLQDFEEKLVEFPTKDRVINELTIRINNSNIRIINDAIIDVVNAKMR